MGILIENQNDIERYKKSLESRKKRLKYFCASIIMVLFLAGDVLYILLKNDTWTNKLCHFTYDFYYEYIFWNIRVFGD